MQFFKVRKVKKNGNDRKHNNNREGRFNFPPAWDANSLLIVDSHGRKRSPLQRQILCTRMGYCADSARLARAIIAFRARIKEDSGMAEIGALIAALCALFMLLVERVGLIHLHL